MSLITSTHFTTKPILYLFIYFSLSHYFLHFSNPFSCTCSPHFHFNSSFFLYQSLIFQNKFPSSNKSPKFEIFEIPFSKIIFPRFQCSKFNFPKFYSQIYFFKIIFQNFQNSKLNFLKYRSQTIFQNSNFKAPILKI